MGESGEKRMGSTNLLDNLRTEIELQWNDISRYLHGKYGFEIVEQPTVIFQRDEDGISPVGQMSQGHELLIPSSYQKHLSLLRALLSFHCFKASFPVSSICKECVHDLSMEFARQQLGSADSTRWLKIWKEVTPPRKELVSIVYDPARAYEWLESVSGNQGFTAILDEIIYSQKHGISLSFEDYLVYFRERAIQFVNHLDDLDIRLLSALFRDPTINSNELAEDTGISRTWVTKKLNVLRETRVMRRYERVPFSSIDIRILYVLLTNSQYEGDVLSLIVHCPFLYSYQRILSGEGHALAVLCVPSNPLSMKSLQKAFDALGRWGIKSEILQVASSGTNCCFDFYRPETTSWNIPWVLLSVQFNRIVQENLGGIFPRIDEPENRTSLSLDTFDFQILECVRHGTSSISQIRKELQSGQHRVAQRVRELREAKLIVPTIEVRNIGLQEHLFLLTYDKVHALALNAFALRLPYSIISFSLEDALIITLSLPAGGAYSISDVLGRYNESIRCGMLGTKMFGDWGLPTELWDSENQRWNCPSEGLQRWLQDLN